MILSTKFSLSIYNDFRNNILPKYRKLEKEHDLLMRSYVKSLIETYPEKTFFADANSTLRLTYGKVEGSLPKDGITYNWFTTIDGIVEKFNTGESDYKIPNRLLELYNQKIMVNMDQVVLLIFVSLALITPQVEIPEVQL